EIRASIDIEAFEEIAGEQSGKRPQPFEIDRANPRLGGRSHGDGVHRTAVKVERHPVVGRPDAGTMQLVEDVSQLAEAPTELAAGVVGGVPQKVAKPAARYRARGKSKIAKEGSCLARGGEFDGDAIPNNGQGTQQPYG